MASRVAVATDDFNRAALGANWQQLVPLDGAITIVGSTHLETFDHAAARWIGAGTFSKNQYSSLVVKSIPDGGQGGFMGVIARASGDLDTDADWYVAGVTDDDTLTIAKRINGVNTTLDTLPAIEFAVNDRIEIEVEGDAPNITIRALKNGVSLLEVTGESDLADGLPGVRLNIETTPVWQADDWEGGNLVTGVSMSFVSGSFVAVNPGHL